MHVAMGNSTTNPSLPQAPMDNAMTLGRAFFGRSHELPQLQVKTNFGAAITCRRVSANIVYFFGSQPPTIARGQDVMDGTITQRPIHTEFQCQKEKMASY